MISAKKDTIELMKLIGASNETIRTPFILEGFFQGLPKCSCCFNFTDFLKLFFTQLIQTLIYIFGKLIQHF